MIMESSQWLFPVEALNHTPSASPLYKELYDRARGVEFLFRLGSSLALLVFSQETFSIDTYTRQ